MVKVDFEFVTAYGVYRDALHLPADHSFSEDAIKQMQADRLDAWVKAIEQPQVQEYEIVILGDVSYYKSEIDGRVILTPVEVPNA